MLNALISCNDCHSYCDVIWKEFQDRLAQSRKQQIVSQMPTSMQNSTDLDMLQNQPIGRLSTVSNLFNVNSNANTNPTHHDNMSGNHYNLSKHSAFQTSNTNNALSDIKWEEASKIYLTLLDVYLHPNNNNAETTPYIQDALKMLEKNHDRIDAIAVFNVLPHTLSVNKCIPYMEAILKTCFDKKRNNQVIKNLLKQSNLKVSNLKIMREQAYQVVDDQTVCKKCKKRIGQSAFLRYSDGNVFHYICVKAAQLNADITKPYSFF